MSELNFKDQTQTTSANSTSKGTIRTRTIGELVEDIGMGYNRSQLLTNDATDLTRQFAEMHSESTDLQINNEARSLATNAPEQLLNLLADKGFAWRDIARMAGVSVPSVRKWRLGESPTPTNHLAIARIVAVVQILEHDLPVTDIASWMEMPLIMGVPTNAIDLVSDGLLAQVIALALGHVRPEVVMDSHIPDWRDRVRRIGS
jgi:hypothetical protein